MERFSWVLDILPKILGWTGSVFGFFLVSWRWIRRALRAIRLADDFHHHFGDRCVEDIKRFVDEIRRCHTESEIRHRLAENYLLIGVYICNRDGLLTWANEHLCERFGLDMHSLEGNGWLSALPEEDREDAYNHWMAAVRNHIPYDCRYTIINQRTNKVQAMRTRAYSIRDDKNEVQCYVGYVVEDVSDNEKE